MLQRFTVFTTTATHAHWHKFTVILYSFISYINYYMSHALGSDMGGGGGRGSLWSHLTAISLPSEVAPVWLNSPQLKWSRPGKSKMMYINIHWCILMILNWNILMIIDYYTWIIRKLFSVMNVEGWHRRMNHRGHAQLPFYIMIGLLHEESNIVDLQVRLVSEKKLQHHQRKTYKKLHAQYDSMWTAYASGEKTAKQLLYACARINGPITN